MARLERTDKPVSVLLNELDEGVLGLPEIQRGYVWNRPQARDLVDSLYREYPSGLILLWKPKELPELRKVSVDSSTSKIPDLLILDGQQRLTSLKKIFMGEIDVYFNVKDEEFQIFSRKLKGNPLWVPVQKVVNNGAVKVWRELKDRLASQAIHVPNSHMDTYLERLSQLEQIKEYRFPVMIIHTEDYEEITESFIRVNSKGTRLREAELAMAQLAFRWPGVLVKEFEEALDEYEESNFELEARFLMRCYVAVATGQSRFRFLGELWKKQHSELEEIWKITKRAVDHTINLLKNNVGIESSDWIPSVNALIPIIFYLSKKQQLADEEAKNLLFWFFEATVHGRFTSSVETKLDQDLKALESENPIGNLISNLKKDLASLEITPEMIEGKYQRHPFQPLLFVIFRQNGAKDWFTATALSSTNVGPEYQLELHHIFPKAVLKEAGGFKSEEIDDIANIAFLSQKANRSILRSKPEVYLNGIESTRLEAQLVPLEKELWKLGNYRMFLKERRTRLVNAVNEYLQSLGKEHFYN